MGRRKTFPEMNAALEHKRFVRWLLKGVSDTGVGAETSPRVSVTRLSEKRKHAESTDLRGKW